MLMMTRRKDAPRMRRRKKSRNHLAKEFFETAVTVGLLVLFFECAFVELLQAEGTHKVLGMELPEHGCDATTCKKEINLLS